MKLFGATRLYKSCSHRSWVHPSCLVLTNEWEPQEGGGRDVSLQPIRGPPPTAEVFLPVPLWLLEWLSSAVSVCLCTLEKLMLWVEKNNCSTFPTAGCGDDRRRAVLPLHCQLCRRCRKLLMDDSHFLSCVLDTLGAYDPLLLDYMFLI